MEMTAVHEVVDVDNISVSYYDFSFFSVFRFFGRHFLSSLPINGRLIYQLALLWIK